MHIVITRPKEDSLYLIENLIKLGHTVTHLPVIKIQNVNYDKVNINEFSGIIFTSANAIKNLNTSDINKKINCFCVGSSTENVAKQNGFQNIFCAEGNVNNLKEVILQNFDNRSGNLLYVSGEIVSSNLDKDLISEGYKVKRIINYSVLPVEEIGEEFINNLKSSIPDMVYVYSENSAKNYLNLLKK